MISYQHNAANTCNATNEPTVQTDSNGTVQDTAHDADGFIISYTYDGSNH